MLYHKLPLEDGKYKTVELYDDEIVTFCPTCGNEYQLEPEEIADIIHSGADFGGTSYYCNGCYTKPLRAVK